MIRTLAALLAAFATGALAQIPPPLPVYPAEIDIAAEASREVDNDEMHATLSVEASDASAAKVANRLNRVTGDALKTAQAYEAVRTTSGSSNTFPVYERSGKLTGWRGRAELRLESRDAQGLSVLVARLQSSMQLSGVRFTIARETRRQVEDALIAEAIASFKARAKVAIEALPAKGYKIKKLAINAGARAPVPRPYAARAAVAAAPSATAPVFEPGTSIVTVRASGTVIAQ